MNKKIVKRSLDTSSEKYQVIEGRFYALAREFGGKTPPEQQPVWEKIENFLSSLVINNGWTRKSIYELFGNILDKEIKKGSAKDSQDALIANSFIAGEGCAGAEISATAGVGRGDRDR